jgi:hypothetical protein
MPRLLITAALAAGALATAPSSGATSAPKLFGKVGPGFTITLKDATGKKVQRVKPGVYTFVIGDRSTIHDFTLEQESGGTYEQVLTGDGFTGARSVKVKLTAGRWKYYCVAHAPSMFAFFTVR